LQAATGFTEAFAASEIVDLSRRLEEGIPTYPTHPKYFQMRWCSLGDPARMNQLVLGEHSGTHLDAPAHFVELGRPGYRTIDEIPLNRFLGRAVKLSFGPFEASNAMIPVSEIRDWERRNLAIEADDVVLIDFGWGHRWAAGPNGFSYLDRWPGLSREAAEYLAGKKVKLVGTDCISLDPGDGGESLAAHYTLLPEGILILENVCNLAQINVVSFFMALPLRVGGGTGSPVRAVAVQPRRT
jgi:kynurenine formamidase